MKTEKLLLTGITGFVGRHVATLLRRKKNFEITALIRPKTDVKRYQDFADFIRFEEIDLTDIEKLRDFLDLHSFKKILHIGAIRGGRKFSNELYYKANVEATEQLLIHAKKNSSKFIFCSSVGIFGAIPNELPANNATQRLNDNYYHYTKIQAEALLQNYVLQGVNAVIIRPSITYGKGDYGFPHTLIKLVEKKMMLLSDQRVLIHMTNVNVLAEAFIKLLEKHVDSGSAYIVADREPIVLSELVQYISKELNGKEYPQNRTISRRFFHTCEHLAVLLKNDLWKNRFQLISKSWYYNIENTRTDLSIRAGKTIPDFKTVIDWYKTKKRK